MNEDLLAAATSSRSTWVWIDKAVWVFPSTIRYIAETGRKLIHFAGDPMIMFHRTRRFISSIPRFDVLITTKPYEVDLYRQHGAKRVLVVKHGFDPKVFRNRPTTASEDQRFGSDVCFVGHHEAHYRHLIHAAAQLDADLAVWGRWQRATLGRPWLKRVVRGNGVWDEDYVAALNTTRIGLGLLTHLAPDQSTTRTFEIPACGALLLAERTKEHLDLFEEGVEAEFFDSDGELQEKIHWYLSHEDERRLVAERGMRRVVEGGYTHTDRLRSVVGEIPEIFSPT